MEIREMQRIVDEWIKSNTPGYWKPSNMMLRVMEEVGELAREINHRFGEKPKKAGREEGNIGEEIADIIFALLCMANSLNIDLEKAFEGIMEKYERRDKERFKRA
ncbi:nucleotide pyrophosphohydrolase [Nanoarchaeota archaeon]|nr:MAG: nucleotide pyrophosphohydrolase [Nanoarchaeota archaeon]